MYRLSIFVVLLCFTVATNAEKKTVQYKGVSCQYETEKGMLNGEYKSFYENGKTKCEGSFLQNNRIGFWVFYHPNGTIQCIREYRDNYHYEQKNAKNEKTSVQQTPGAIWKSIAEKDILCQTKHTALVTVSNNPALFTELDLMTQLIRIVNDKEQQVFTDARWVSIADKNVLKQKDIVGLQIKEQRILDKNNKVLQYRITGMAPMVWASDGINMAPVCWIYYPPLMQALQKVNVNNKNFPFATNLLEVFENRLFHAEALEVQTIKSIMLNENTPAAAQLSHADIMDIEEENSLIISNFVVK